MGNFRQFVKKIPGSVQLLKFARDRKYDMTAIRAFREERKIRREEPIKVGFLCQYIPAWTKVERIYQLMCRDARFEPFLICLPSNIRNNHLTAPDSLANDTYDYFLSHGYPEAKNALVDRETWMDLKALKLSYLFYPRPYNAFMPPEYTTHNTSCYCKNCLLMYGIEILEEITNITLNRDFMAYVSYYFAENIVVKNVNVERNRIAHQLGLQKTVCLGMPVLESLSEKKGKKSASWEFSSNDFRVIWTPRWTTDPTEGGSNFFTYAEVLTRYALEHTDMDFLYRPHPLTFAHFVETGEMTEQEVADFKDVCWRSSNISLDDQQQYEATLWESSVLISDYSGLIPEYFATGKPLIFCISNMVLTLSDFGKRIVEGCYVVENETELFACLDMLKRGEDPLYEKRQNLIQELYGDNEGVCERILQSLIEGVRKE